MQAIALPDRVGPWPVPRVRVKPVRRVDRSGKRRHRVEEAAAKRIQAQLVDL